MTVSENEPMTSQEKETSLKLQKLVSEYESTCDVDVRRRIHHEINNIREVSEFDLNEYYGACDLEEFCDSLAIEVIRGVDFSKEEAEPVVRKLCSLSGEDFREFDYLHQKYGSAIEFVYKKYDYLFSAIVDKEMSFEEIMDELHNSDAGGPIIL